MKYFGTDGARGIANRNLTATMAYRMGRFIGQYPHGKKNRILIARDTRISGEMLLNSLIAGILASGSDVYDEGVSTTPSISYLVQNGAFDYGIMISASHNPYYDNGIKFFNQDGEKISAEIESLIEEYIDAPSDHLPFKINDEIGRLIRGEVLVDKYIEFLASRADDLHTLKVMVDGANGSASAIAPRLFKRLNIQADFINVTPNGTNINDRCGSTHLEQLAEEVQKGQYDLGLAFDGDADRLLAVAPDGTIINGDDVLYLNGVYLKKHGLLKNDTMVITTMSNIGLKKACEKADINLLITDVGDKYVQAELKKHGLSLGGEQSGHIIFLDDLNTGDGMLTAIKIMNVLVEEKRPLLELIKHMVAYPQVLKNITVVNKAAILSHEGLKALIHNLDSQLNGDGRILVRPSGTEPLVRVMCEASTMTICETIVDEIVAYIESINY